MVQYPPREPLALLPSPFVLLERATARWGRGRRIWCKRDDLTGSLLTGNKVRKLEFIAAEARARKCTVLVTAGALQSNHCRATAAVAAQLGLKCELILRGEEQALEGNYLLSRLLDADMNGVLDAQETRRAILMINPNLTRKEIKEVMRGFAGTDISIDTFVDVLTAADLKASSSNPPTARSSRFSHGFSRRNMQGQGSAASIGVAAVQPLDIDDVP